MKMRFGIIVVIAFLIQFFGCKEGESEVSADSYYYEMSIEDSELLINKVKTLKTGDNIKYIINLLGKPHFEKVLVTKNGKFIAKKFVYYLKRWEKDFVNEKRDSYVSISFDHKDCFTGYEIENRSVGGD